MSHSLAVKRGRTGNADGEVGNKLTHKKCIKFTIHLIQRKGWACAIAW